LIKNILFDFDGVLCESVHIKTEAFYEMYLPYGTDIALKVKEHHIANGGMSRYDKFKHYEQTFFAKELSKEKMAKLSEQFSELVKKKVIAAPFVKGALEFLQKHSNNYKCFIVSATPIEEMKEIAKAKKIDHYFEEIYGSPKNKIIWGKHILDTYKIEANETLFIGDALSDYNAAQAHNMHFLLRKTNENKNLFSHSIYGVHSLKNLNDEIKIQYK